MARTVSPARHYLNDGYGIKSWLLTRDHKRIATVMVPQAAIVRWEPAALNPPVRQIIGQIGENQAVESSMRRKALSGRSRPAVR